MPKKFGGYVYSTTFAPAFERERRYRNNETNFLEKVLNIWKFKRKHLSLHPRSQNESDKRVL